MNAALMARIDSLEQENATLKQYLEAAAKRPFRLADIVRDNKLVGVYAGFPSYEILLAFFVFLGPAVNHLNYWGTTPKTRSQRRNLMKFCWHFLYF